MDGAAEFLGELGLKVFVMDDVAVGIVGPDDNALRLCHFT
jgi:hypothetical protein